MFRETAQPFVIPMLCVPNSRTRRGGRSKELRRRWQLTRDWQQAAERRMEELGISRIELARRMGLSEKNRSIVTNMLKEGQNSSEYVPDACEVLGIGMPVLGTDAEIADLVSRLAPDDRKAVLQLIQRLLPPTGAGPKG